jgi:hypothetical protein
VASLLQNRFFLCFGSLMRAQKMTIKCCDVKRSGEPFFQKRKKATLPEVYAFSELFLGFPAFLVA